MSKHNESSIPKWLFRHLGSGLAWYWSSIIQYDNSSENHSAAQRCVPWERRVTGLLPYWTQSWFDWFSGPARSNYYRRYHDASPNKYFCVLVAKFQRFIGILAPSQQRLLRRRSLVSWMIILKFKYDACMASRIHWLKACGAITRILPILLFRCSIKIILSQLIVKSTLQEEYLITASNHWFVILV